MKFQNPIPRQYLAIFFVIAIVISLPAGVVTAQETEYDYPMDCETECNNDNSMDGWDTEGTITHENDFTFENEYDSEFTEFVFIDTVNWYDSYWSTENPSESNGHIRMEHVEGETSSGADESIPEIYDLASLNGYFHTQTTPYPWEGGDNQISWDYNESASNGLYNTTFTLRGENTDINLTFAEYQSDNNPIKVELSTTGNTDTITSYTGGSKNYSTITIEQVRISSSSYINATIEESDGVTHNLSVAQTGGDFSQRMKWISSMSGPGFDNNTDGAYWDVDNFNIEYTAPRFEMFESYGLPSSYLNGDLLGMTMQPAEFNDEMPIRSYTGIKQNTNDSNVPFDVSDGFTWDIEELYMPTVSDGTQYQRFGLTSNIDENIAIEHEIYVENYDSGEETWDNMSWKIHWVRNGNIQETIEPLTNFAIWDYWMNQSIESNTDATNISIYAEHFDNPSQNFTLDYQFDVPFYLSQDENARMFIDGYSVSNGSLEQTEMQLMNMTFTDASTSLDSPSNGGNGGSGDDPDPSEDDSELSLGISKSTLDPGETVSYNVFDRTTDVTGETSVHSDNKNIATVDENNHTITATSDENYVNNSVIIVAEYDGLQDTNTIFVGSTDSGNIPGGGSDPDDPDQNQGVGDTIQLDFLTAFLTLLSENIVLFIFLVTILNTAITVLTNPFVGVGSTTMILILGYVVGFIPLGMLILSIVLILVLLINLRKTMRFGI